MLQHTCRHEIIISVLSNNITLTCSLHLNVMTFGSVEILKLDIKRNNNRQTNGFLKGKYRGKYLAQPMKMDPGE